MCDGYNEAQLNSVLHEFESYFSSKPGFCEIVLCEGATPVNLPPRQIPGGIRDKVRAELDKMLEGGIIVESSIRLCVDFRELNSRTSRGSRSEHVSLYLAMEQNSSDLTTFVCPFGKFRYK